MARSAGRYTGRNTGGTGGSTGGSTGRERVVQKVSSTRTFGRIAPHVIPVIDRAVHRATRGRKMLSTQMLPGVVLTSTGAKSGLPRRTPLACMPEEERGSWLLVGSNFGREGHPGWTANLRSHPDAVISYKGAEIPVRARELEGAERAEAWAALLRFWPPYAVYQARVERRIRVFRLERRRDADERTGADTGRTAGAAGPDGARGETGEPPAR